MLIGDSAYPPAEYPTEFGGEPVVGWCVYIGGNAYHVWTEQEIQRLIAQPWCRYVLPVYVRSNPAGADLAAVDAAAALAWARAHDQPAGTLIMWDYETAVDSVYELTVNTALRAGGELEVLYGSKSTVVRNAAPSGGYDEADWTGRDHAPESTAVQFYSCAAYDLNDFRADAPLWELRPAPTAAAPVMTSQEDEMSTTSVNGRAGLSWPAGSRHVVQVTYDPAGGDPSLRVVLALASGPWVAPERLAPTRGSGSAVFEIPAQSVAACRGVILEGAAGVVYDACAA